MGRLGPDSGPSVVEWGSSAQFWPPSTSDTNGYLDRKDCCTASCTCHPDVGKVRRCMFGSTYWLSLRAAARDSIPVRPHLTRRIGRIPGRCPPDGMHRARRFSNRTEQNNFAARKHPPLNIGSQQDKQNCVECICLGGWCQQRHGIYSPDDAPSDLAEQVFDVSRSTLLSVLFL